MKPRLSHETREQTGEESLMTAEHRTDESLNFDSAETMIRHDAAQTPVPPQLRDRVMQSIAREVPINNPAPWWKRWMPF